jgi:hypothetical protein
MHGSISNKSCRSVGKTMIKSTLCAISLGIAVAGGLAGAASAASIADSSFETPVVGAGYVYGPAVIGATFTNGAGVQGNGSAWGFAAAPDGNQTAFLQSGGASSIDLNVTGLLLGGTYEFSFFEAQRPNYGINSFTVSFNGTQIGSFTPTTPAWTQVTTHSFTALNTQGTLTFASAARFGDNDTGLDAITIAGGVPEPASWALMIGGFGLAGAALRRRPTYRLVEIAADGRTSSEAFRADDDASALAQAIGVAEGVALEIWRDDTLVTRCDLSGLAAA